MVDATIITFLIVCGLVGFLSGFVWQAVRLVSVVLSIWLGRAYGYVVSDYLLLRGVQLSGFERFLLCPVGVFLVSLMACYMVAYLFRRPIDAAKPQTADRWVGAFFGLAKGVLLIGVAALIAVHGGGRDTGLRRAVGDSMLARGTAFAVFLVQSAARDALPPDVQEGIPRTDAFIWPEVS